jgi:predicted DNA-binding transcriptional regulator YafY
MLRILNLIDSGRTVTRSILAGELKVTVRSADRYIAALRSAGFPIRYSAERGSYVFVEGYSLSRTDLSADEALALGLAKGMLSRFGSGTGRVLDGLEKKMGKGGLELPGHIVFSGQAMPPEVEEHFRKLNYAITNLRQVELVYSTASKGGERSCRVVDPHYLLHRDNVWYLRAYCRKRRGPRLFALDRIESLTVLDRSFLPKPEITPDEFTGAAGIIAEGEPVQVVVRFDRARRPYLRRFTFPGQEEKELADGRIELRFTTNGLAGVKLWLYRHIPHFEVVEPKELKEEMRRECALAAMKI